MLKYRNNINYPKSSRKMFFGNVRHFKELISQNSLFIGHDSSLHPDGIKIYYVISNKH